MKRIIVRGRVQGVFFRYNTKKYADEHNIKGYVRNLSNGSVEIVADKLDGLIEFCKSNPGYSEVSDVFVQDVELEEKFNDFYIK